MSKFTVEEMNLMCIYDTGSREDSIIELSEMKKHLEEDETELLKLTHSVIDKLKVMSDDAYDSVTEELIADFD